MLEQIGNALTFYAQFLVAGAKGTGLTITCSVYKGSDGSSIVTGQSATEIGNTGIYKYTLTANNVTAEDDYIALFNEAAATADQTDIPALWVVGRDWIEKMGLIASGEVTVINAVADDGETLELVRGDDYLEAESRELSFSSDSWPNLTTATQIIMTIRRRAEGFTSGGTSDPVLISREDVSGSRVAGSGTQTVVFELDTTEGTGNEEGDTNDLLVGTGSGKYDIQATLSNTTIITLVTGVVNVTEDQTRV